MPVAMDCGTQTDLIIVDWDGFLAKTLHVWLEAFQSVGKYIYQFYEI
jgi:hypothetical protein